jgi:hypothetical protein
MEREAAEQREAGLREALQGLREGVLRGAVRGHVWSTLLVLALLRSRYAATRRAWFALEARALSWLEAAWPPLSTVGVSAPAAVMRATALMLA